jgi:hypothetical protein
MGSTDFIRLPRYFEELERYPRRRRGLCIGDSWFQYPLRSYADLQQRIALPSVLGKRVNFVDDSYPGRDADEVQGLHRRWLRLARTLQEEGRPFDLFLLSLGGNDVVGLDFARHLTDGTRRDGRAWPWAAEVPPAARRWIDLGALKATFDGITSAYGLIVAMRDTFAPGATIIGHTYADVTPMDVPYTFLTYRSGPWIWGPCTARGIAPAEQKLIVRWLLASFANLLRAIAQAAGRFVVLDTRLELPDPAEWDNEIHPRGPGFRHLVERYWRPAIEAALA